MRTELDGAILVVDSPDDASKFYTAAFEFGVVFRAPDGGLIQLDSGSSSLLLARRGDMAAGVPGPTHNSHSTGPILVIRTDEMQQTWDRAISAGAQPITPYAVRPWGQTTGLLRSPDGTLIDLGTPWSPSV